MLALGCGLNVYEYSCNSVKYGSQSPALLCGVFEVFFIIWMWARLCCSSFAYLPKDQFGGFMNMSAVIHLPLWFPIHASVFIFSYPFISLKEFLSFLCWCPCAMSRWICSFWMFFYYYILFSGSCGIWRQSRFILNDLRQNYEHFKEFCSNNSCHKLYLIAQLYMKEKSMLQFKELRFTI